MVQAIEKKRRTCIACGQNAPKSTLFRLMLVDGKLSFDKSGKGAGRGAYVCSKPCFEEAVTKRKFSRAFKREVNYDRASALSELLDTVEVRR